MWTAACLCLAPIRERDLARCSQCHLVRSLAAHRGAPPCVVSKCGPPRVGALRRFAAARTPLAKASGAGSLYAIRKWECLVSPAGADSRALAPHSLRERDLARCSQRHLARSLAAHGD